MRNILVSVFCVAFAGCGSTPVSNTSNTVAVNNNTAASPSPAPAHSATPHASPAAANSTSASDGKGPHTVKFAAGATSASYSGTFSGYDVVDYVLDAKEGQTLSAEFTHNDGNAAIMTIMQKNLKIADDSAETDKWSGKLPATGSYTIRVGQMRNTARRGNTPVKFTLKISIT